MCSDLLESQNNVRQIPDDNQQKSPMVVVNLNSNSKNVSPNIASYGSVVSTHATQQHHECSIMPNTKADIDTSDLYPTLNFNVSTTQYVFSFVSNFVNNTVFRWSVQGQSWQTVFLISSERKKYEN